MDLGGDFGIGFDALAFEKNFDWEYEPDFPILPPQERPLQPDLDDESGSSGFVPLPVVVEAPVVVEPKPVVAPKKVEPPKPKFQVNVRLIKTPSGRERLAVLGAAARASRHPAQSLASISSSATVDAGTREVAPQPSGKKDCSDDNVSINAAMLRVFNVNANPGVNKHQASALVALAMAMTTTSERRRKFAEGLRAFDNRFMRCVASRWTQEDEKDAQDLDALILQQTDAVATLDQEDESETVDGELSVEEFMDVVEDSNPVLPCPCTTIPAPLPTWRSTIQEFKSAAVTVGPKKREPTVTTSAKQIPSFDGPSAPFASTSAKVTCPKNFQPKILLQKRSANLGRSDDDIKRRKRSLSGGKSNSRKSVTKETSTNRCPARSSKATKNLNSEAEASLAILHSLICSGSARRSAQQKFSSQAEPAFKYDDSSTLTVKDEPDQEPLAFVTMPDSQTPVKIESKLQPKRGATSLSSTISPSSSFSSLAESPRTPVSVALSGDFATSVIRPRTLPRYAQAHSRGRGSQNHDQKQKAALWAQLRAKCDK